MAQLVVYSRSKRNLQWKVYLCSSRSSTKVEQKSKKRYTQVFSVPAVHQELKGGCTHILPPYILYVYSTRVLLVYFGSVSPIQFKDRKLLFNRNEFVKFNFYFHLTSLNYILFFICDQFFMFIEFVIPIMQKGG